MRSIKLISMWMIVCVQFLDLIGKCIKWDDMKASIIYTFFPDAALCDKIISIQRYLIYIPLRLNVISHMTCWVTDQNGK